MKKRIVVAALVASLLLLGTAVSASEIVLKNGEKLYGTVVAEFGDKAVIKLDTGERKTVRKDEIDRIVEASAENDVNVDTPRGPSLGELVKEHLGELLQAGGEDPGFVVLQKEGKVYIDIGSTRGAKAGDAFDVVDGIAEIRHPVTNEILSVERNVIAKLRVISVQEKISICEIISGQLAVSLPTGEQALRVLPKEEGENLIAVGVVEVQSGVAIQPEILDSAISSVLRDLGVESPASKARYRVNALAAKGDIGIAIQLSLVSNASKNVINRTSFDFIPQTRYRSAFEASLNRQLSLDPIAVQAEKFYKIERGSDYIIVKNVGSELHDVAILQNGKCFVLLAKRVKSLKDVELALGSYKLVMGKIVKPVRADITDATARDTWYGDLRVYTSQGNVYRRISIPTGRKGVGYTLSVPNVQIREARLWAVGTGKHMSRYYYDSVVVGNCATKKVEYGDNNLDISCGIAYGEQKIQNGRGACCRSLDFLTDGGEGEFILFDTTRNPIGIVMPPCRPISELEMPFIFGNAS